MEKVITWERWRKQFITIDDAVFSLMVDVALYEIVNDKVNKLLRLAACSAAHTGEKENALKAAFKML